MIIYVIAIAVLCLIGGKPYLRGFNRDYLAKENTDGVRGVFILLIFAAHFIGYVDPFTAPLDILYRKFWRAMGQAVVTCFLFYSGYGIALNIRQKGEEYVRNMPRRRILSTLLTFDCSVMIYSFLQLGRGKVYMLKTFILSLLAWESVGNSNWYIFAILGLWFITWLVLRGKELNAMTVAQVTVCTFGFILFLRCAGRDSWWYNTILCYPMGMWFFLYKDKIDNFMSEEGNYWAVAILTGIAYVVAHKFWDPPSGVMYALTMLLFTLCVVFLTMKFQIRNPVLIYCGRHVGGLFFLHRIPFIILGDHLPYKKGPGIYLFFALAVMGGFALEFLFSKIMAFLQNGASAKTGVHSEFLCKKELSNNLKDKEIKPSWALQNGSGWQFSAIKLFYIVVVPIFSYLLILAIATPANSYEFMPVLTLSLTLLIWFAVYKSRAKISVLLQKWCDNKAIMVTMIVLWGILLIYFSLTLQVEYTWDYGGAMRAAHQLASEGAISFVTAYARYPNNKLLVTALYGVCKILLFLDPDMSLESFRIAGCLISSLSIFISGLIFAKIACLFNEALGKLFLLIYMTCIPLWLYSTICYTDTLGLPILTAGCWCAAKAIKKRESLRDTVKWMILHGILMSLAYAMKATLAIPFIAVLVAFFLYTSRHGALRKAVGFTAIMVVAFAVTFSLVDAGTTRAMGITPQMEEECEFPLTHWVMMSMYTGNETYDAGGFQQNDVDYTMSFASRAEREAAVRERLIERLENPQRPLAEHILFQKIRRIWSNGTLAADDYAGRGPIKRGILHEIFIFGGESWKITRVLMQIWWIQLLAAVLLDVIFRGRRCKKRELSPVFVMHLTILGFFLFYLAWEVNPRYLVVLLPVLALTAADGIIQLCKAGKTDGERTERW